MESEERKKKKIKRKCTDKSQIKFDNFVWVKFINIEKPVYNFHTKCNKTCIELAESINVTKNCKQSKTKVKFYFKNLKSSSV